MFDDYFTRNTDPGNYSLSIDGQLQNNKPTFHGTKGVWQMHLDIDSNFKINQSVFFQGASSDPCKRFFTT